MADTGAPWNLPYPLPTDLVRDGAQAIEDLAEATATGLSLAGNPGIGSNVVQTVKDDPFSSTATSFTDVTGLSVTITPTAASSKVLVIVSMSAVLNSQTNQAGLLTLTDGANNVLVNADDPGSRSRAFASSFNSGVQTAFGDLYTYNYILVHFPNTASPFTYKVRCRMSAGTLFVNRDISDANNENRARSTSQIIAIEVAA